MKYFLISIDTEGDNLWNWRQNDTIETRNALYLPRFQCLCEQYGFKPTYLSNYEMVMSPIFQRFAKDIIQRQVGEIGMHLHAWNTPPFFKLDSPMSNPGAPYIVEYPSEIIEKKVSTMQHMIKEMIGIDAITHRAGRWSTNDEYLRILRKSGIKFDCSFTPHVNWSDCKGTTIGSCGNDYRNESESPTIINRIADDFLEIPVTIRKTHHLFRPNRLTPRQVAGSIYKSIKSQAIWLRPNGKNTNQMKWLIESVAEDCNSEYIMFMLHSSELMPGGSPTFENELSIEKLYSQLKEVFDLAVVHFKGITIGEYGSIVMDKLNGDLK